jgi:hypothetical protein
MSRETKTAGAAEIAGRMAGFVWSHQPAGTPVAAAADAARRYNDEFEPAAGNGATLYYVFEDGFLQTALYMVNSGSPLVARIDKDSRKES